MRPGIELRAYGELNDFLPPGHRQRPFLVEFEVSPAVKDLVEAAGIPHPEVELLLVNGEAVGAAHRVADGDRVAVYPTFRSIDLGDLPRITPAPPAVLTFVVDVHLAKLARWLRLLGFDVLAPAGATDPELVSAAASEPRVLLTRDRGLLKRREITHGYCVRSTDPDEQLHEIVQRYSLAGAANPFSRCLSCNGLLADADAVEVAPDVPPGVLEQHREFRRCEACERVYWPGSHYTRLLALARSALRPDRGSA